MTEKNIEQIEMKIDYEKLANAIVKAQEISKRKSEKRLGYRSKTMRFLNGTCYSTFYCVALIKIHDIWKGQYSTGVVSYFKVLVLTCILIVVAVSAFLCQQESFADDGEASLTHFNMNITLIAMVVSLVALLKG